MTIPLRDWIWYALAVAVGMLAAIMELHTDNLQFLVLFVFVHCAVFGYARPDRAWRWAGVIALCIPLVNAFNCVVALPSPRDLGFPANLFLGPLVVFFKATRPIVPFDILDSCLALVPAMTGAYAGAWMSRVAASD